ncbi:MAG: class I SAM-dependent methyltransferase [Thermodesulfovibrionales bacterium]
MDKPAFLSNPVSPISNKLNYPYPIFLDYPLRSESRYGWGKPPHPKLYEILNRSRKTFEGHLQTFLAFKANYLAIPKYHSDNQSNEPAWINGMMPGLDAAALYGFVSLLRPKRYFEVGIGQSTKFVRRAISDQRLPTRITAIEPYPHPGIEDICDALIQKPLELIDLEIFDELEAGDILFIDNSHRVFMNSDATVAFLDILPRLRPGVIVEFHDIVLPFDYPPQWAERHYSEQYLLAAYLLAEGNKFEVLLANAFISLDAELNRILNPVWQDPLLNGAKEFDMLATIQKALNDKGAASGLVLIHGSSFWLRING